MGLKEMFLGNARRTLATVLISSFMLQIVFALTLNNNADQEYWLIIIQNTETGNGSYGLNGNFYTPIWGYLLSFMAMLMKFMGTFPFMEHVFPELAEATFVNGMKFVQPSPAVTLFLKFPLILCDLAVGYILFNAISEITNDEKKGLTATALWCFSPIVLFMVSIQTQFDVVMVLMLLITVYLVRSDRNFLAGVMFGAGILLKLFPAFCFFPLVAYLFARHRGSEFWKQIGLAAFGAILIIVVVYVPVIMDGTFVDSLGFMTSRRSNEGWMFTLKAAVLFVIFLFISYALSKKIAHSEDEETAWARLFMYTALFMAFANIVATGYQYIPSVIWVAIAFMCLHKGKGYTAIFIILSLSSVIEGLFFTNTSIIAMSVAYYGWWTGLADLASANLAFYSAPFVMSTPGFTDVVGFLRFASVCILVFFGIVQYLNEEYGFLGKAYAWLRRKGVME